MTRRNTLVALVAASGLFFVIGGSPVGANVPVEDDPGGGGGGSTGSSDPSDLDWAPDITTASTTDTGLPITLLPQVTPLRPDLRHRGPWGIWQPNCANDFCMPDVPIQGPYCLDPVNTPGDVMTRNGVAYGNIGRSCYQLIVAVAFQAATGADPNPIEFTLQQFQRNIHQQCNEQFAAWSLGKYKCYAASGIAKDRARPLVQQAYGRIPLPGFNLPILVDPIPPIAHPFPVPWAPAGQYSHAFVATCGSGGSSPCRAVSPGQGMGPGSRLYLTGVVQPRSKMLYTFIDPATGHVLDWWITAEARDNGVVHHEREEFRLDRLQRGPVRVVASFLRWEDGSTASQVVADINLVAVTTGGGGGGGGGSGDPCDTGRTRETPTTCELILE
jgi:hypothetical protein